MKTSRLIAIPDLQVPYHDPVALDAVERYMSDQKWDTWVNIGDLIDFSELSKFTAGSPGLIEARVRESFAATWRILVRHRKILGNKCEMVWIEGNHEFRVKTYAAKHPELGDVLDIPVRLDLESLGIRWVPFWSEGVLYRKGNAYFGHGKYTTIHHAAKHAREYGVCFYYGHTHDVQSHTLVREATGDTLEAGSLGCLCRYDQKYMKGAPSKWQQAFGVFHFLPDGYYNRYVPRIFKGRFVSPEGKVYQGRKGRR